MYAAFLEVRCSHALEVLIADYLPKGEMDHPQQICDEGNSD